VISHECLSVAGAITTRVTTTCSPRRDWTSSMLTAMDDRGVRLSEDLVPVEIKAEGVDGALRRSFHLLASPKLG
jgi:hypothetical protein